MENSDFPAIVIADKESQAGEYSLVSGSKVAVIGGGPAGSMFSYYLLDLADRIGIDIQVDMYEPRDFSCVAPQGCNMCGGIISETLVQNLASDGINLPATVVQRGIDSYMLHMDVGKVRIETPLQEKRIAAVIRGSGPRDIKEVKWKSFDEYLQKLAIESGVNLFQERVFEIKLKNGRPNIKTQRGDFQAYDLLAVATGVNSGIARLFRDLEIAYQPPVTTKTFICEYYLGEETVDQVLGSSMHVFLLNIPRLDFAAIIPKGEYATICMLGENIDQELIQTFLNSKEVKNSMPVGWESKMRSCNCMPRINVNGASQPFTDRIVFIGDCGVTRLYKDGIGAAYRTAKAAASTAVFQGVSTQHFERYFMPVCQSIARDNAFGRINFVITKLIQRLRFARMGLLRMTSEEQTQSDGPDRRMSTVMWDMFTGSAPYLDIFKQTLHPRFLVRFFWNILRSFF